MLYKRFNDTYMLRIDKGEEIMRFLQAFCEQENITLAQVSEMIGIAQENSAVNVLALLMEYKNTHFADFDPMDEFTLE